MNDTVDAMNRISLLQGRNPIDGTRIADTNYLAVDPADLEVLPDSPEGAPPWVGEDGPGQPVERAPDLGPEPMLEPVRNDPGPSRVGAFADFLSGLELMVHDTAAMYRARAVELSPKERDSIIRIVLGAVKRDLARQYAEVAGPPRKRLGRKKLGSGLEAAAGSSIGNDEVPHSSESSPAALPRKRRGRPRKVRQRLDGSTE